VPTPAGFREFRWAKGVALVKDNNLSKQDLRVPNLEAVDPGDLPTYRDGVFLIISEGIPWTTISQPPMPSPRPTPTLRLPLNLNELGSGYGGSLRSGNFKSDACAGGCVVNVWIGPKAPAADRAAVLQALAAVKHGSAT
jgi:hypothetical protein